MDVEFPTGILQNDPHVRAYFAAPPPKARAALKKIRAAIRAVVPRLKKDSVIGIPRLQARLAVRSSGTPRSKNHCSL